VFRRHCHTKDLPDIRGGHDNCSQALVRTCVPIRPASRTLEVNPMSSNLRRGPITPPRTMSPGFEPSSNADTAAAGGLLARALSRSLELPVLAGNRVEVLPSAAVGDAALFDAIDRAADHVNIQQPAWEAGARSDQFVQRLLERGCAHVNLLLEGALPPAQLDRLRRAGVRTCEFQPTRPARAWLHSAVRQRNHSRALVIVDGRVAFIGRVAPSAGAAQIAGDSSDRLLRVEGPVVAELQWLFVDHWRQWVSTPMHAGRYFPALTWVGAQRVGIAPPAGEGEPSAHRRALLAALDAARDRALLICGRGRPGKALESAMVAACDRGVDVHVLLPGDAGRTTRGAGSEASQSVLLHAGVQLHDLNEAAPAAYASVIDGVWSSIEVAGNPNARSFDVCDRLIVLDAEFGRQAEAAFWSDVARSNDAIVDRARPPGPWQRLNLRLSRYLEVSS